MDIGYRPGGYVTMERLAEQNSTTETGWTASQTESGSTNSEPNPEGTTGTDAGTGTKRMLYRSPTDRLLGGVCGGIGELTGIDANLIRILWVIATLATGGGGILAYIALWLLLPVGTQATGVVRPATISLNGPNMGRTAIVLIALGVIWLLANIGVLPWLWDGFWRVMRVIFWPALLIGASYLLLNYAGRGGFNWNWRSTKERVQNGVGERMPTKQSVKQSLSSMRQRFPLKRSRTDRIFMGVCGGIGQRLGIDPNLVRLVWAAFSVGSIGVGVLVYVLLGLFLPEEQITDVQPYVDDGQDVQVIDARTSQF